MADQMALEASWQAVLADELQQPYMQKLGAFLEAEAAAGKQIYPPRADFFRAFELTPFDQVRVVILGQDPYHGPGQAHGLSFSVRPDVRTPPSLVNLYKELETDLGIPRAQHGHLECWARQGVLLLNSVLTVEHKQPASHQKQGWETFTDRAIHELNNRCEHLVFLLWGSYAQRKGAFIDRERHLVLSAAHPSPLAAYRGFFGCRHFSQTNRYLEQHGQPPIDWRVPDHSNYELF